MKEQNLKTTEELPANVAKTIARFAAWRKERRRGERIPEELWRAAIKVGRKFGLYRATQLLRVQYYELKRRLDEPPARTLARETKTSPGQPTFTEIGAPLSLIEPLGQSRIGATDGEWQLELEHPQGPRLRIQYKGPITRELIALIGHLPGISQ